MLSQTFATKLCDALCYSPTIFCDPYTVPPGTEVFIVIHMPTVLDRAFAPFHKHRVAFIPTTQFATTALRDIISNEHFVMKTAVVNTEYQNAPIQNIFGQSFVGFCSKDIADRTTAETKKMWMHNETPGPTWQETMNNVHVAGVLLYASLVDSKNDYFIGLVKEMMTVSLWHYVRGGALDSV